VKKESPNIWSGQHNSPVLKVVLTLPDVQFFILCNSKLFSLSPSSFTCFEPVCNGRIFDLIIRTFYDNDRYVWYLPTAQINVILCGVQSKRKFVIYRRKHHFDNPDFDYLIICTLFLSFPYSHTISGLLLIFLYEINSTYYQHHFNQPVSCKNFSSYILCLL